MSPHGIAPPLDPDSPCPPSSGNDLATPHSSAGRGGSSGKQGSARPPPLKMFDTPELHLCAYYHLMNLTVFSQREEVVYDAIRGHGDKCLPLGR